MNQFCPATMIGRTTLGTHNPRISAQTVTHRLREIGERPPYTLYVLYAAFLFWPSIYLTRIYGFSNEPSIFHARECNHFSLI